MLVFCSAEYGSIKCVREVFSKGLCGAHYTQRRLGKTFTELRDMRPVGLAGVELAEWFITHRTLKQGNCLIWQGRSLSQGYPVAVCDGRRRQVYRFIVEQLVANRNLEPYEVVHHRCAVRKCLLVDHLEITTPASNIGEMWLRKRLRELESENTRLRLAVCH